MEGSTGSTAPGGSPLNQLLGFDTTDDLTEKKLPGLDVRNDDSAGELPDTDTRIEAYGEELLELESAYDSFVEKMFTMDPPTADLVQGYHQIDMPDLALTPVSRANPPASSPKSYELAIYDFAFCPLVDELIVIMAMLCAPVALIG